MPDTFLQNTLVVYKKKPARVVAVADKLEIKLDGGQTHRVRPKDVIMIHPGPVYNLKELTSRTVEDIRTVCELLADDPVTLPELAELLYGDESPSSRWSTWKLVNDGIYFYDTSGSIHAHTLEDAERELAAREAKAKQDRSWRDFLQRVQTGQPLQPEDAEHLKNTEDLALGKTGQSRLLRKLGIEQTPIRAHALLLKLEHWDNRINPHPTRIGLDTQAPKVAISSLSSALASGDRRDLTHLTASAIDDEGNLDPDDAISLDGQRLWIHVADVASAAPPASAADLEARNRGATLYLPELTAPMLPTEVAKQFGLGQKEISPALSFGIDLNTDGTIGSVEIVESLVRVTRLTYTTVEERMREPAFQALWQVAKTIRERRRAAGAVFITLPDVAVRVINGNVQIRLLPELDSRILVEETMIIAGEAAARFAIERDIPFPFISQAGLSIPKENQKQPETLAEMYAYRRKLSPRQITTVPGPHGGLGLAHYTQVTSPLRRYLDLVAHQQLHAYLRNEKILTSEDMMERVGATQAAIAGTRKGERLSNRYWTLVYLSEHPKWRGEGVLVEKGENRGTLLIPELGIDVQIRYRGNPDLNQTLPLVLSEVDPAQSTVYFSVERFYTSCK